MVQFLNVCFSIKSDGAWEHPSDPETQATPVCPVSHSPIHVSASRTQNSNVLHIWESVRSKQVKVKILLFLTEWVSLGRKKRRCATLSALGGLVLGSGTWSKWPTQLVILLLSCVSCFSGPLGLVSIRTVLTHQWAKVESVSRTWINQEVN